MGHLKEASVIFPLASNPQLSQSQLIGLHTYTDSLKKAFRSPQIKNIAVTGSWGVGKSSLLKSFDCSCRRFSRKKSKFLYVSLGEYTAGNVHTSPNNSSQAKANSGNAAKQCPCKAGVKKETRALDDRAVEKRLLLQLFTRFGQENNPISAFRRIPKQPGWMVTSLFFIFALSLLLLLVRQPVADILSNWTPAISAPFIDNFIQVLKNKHTFIKAFLYAVFLFGTAALACVVFRRICASIHMSKFSIKTNVADFDIAEACSGDYLDQYTQELIYILGKNIAKYDRTIVFEDMDRLAPEQCIRIFTRLREINHMLNASLPAQKYVRFIYVLKDDLASTLVCHKFFDYILPVIPTLNGSSSEVIFREYLAKANQGLIRRLTREAGCSQLGKTGYYLGYCLNPVVPRIDICMDRLPQWCHKAAASALKMQKSPTLNILKVTGYREVLNNWNELFEKAFPINEKGLIHIAAPYLEDYRQMFSILNEYMLMVRLYYCNNAEGLMAEDVTKILAFQIYKYLFADDYHNLLNKKDCVLNGKQVDDAASDNKELLKYLIDSKLLSTDSLHYAGFSKKQVAQLEKQRLDNWAKALADADSAQLLTIIQEKIPMDIAYLSKLQERCSVHSGTAPVNAKVLAEVVRLTAMQPHSVQLYHSWFFSQRTVTACLQTFVELQQQHCEGLAFCRTFIDSCTKNDTCGIFIGCQGMLVMQKLWSKEEALFFAAGAPEQAMEDTVVLNNEEKVTIRELFSQYQQQFSGRRAT